VGLITDLRISHSNRIWGPVDFILKEGQVEIQKNLFRINGPSSERVRERYQSGPLYEKLDEVS